MNAGFQLDFLARIQRLIADGSFVATYKFALLQALADLSVEHVPEEDGSLRIAIADIGEKFIEYYWQQSYPLPSYAGDRDGGVLWHTPGPGQAAVISAITRARQQIGGRSLAYLRAQHRKWAALRNAVSRTVEEMPLGRLQTIEGHVDDFLYSNQGWDAEGGAIRLRPGIPLALRTFHGLIVALCRDRWVQHLRRIPHNQLLIGEKLDLYQFLFESSRDTLEAYRAVLHEHQQGACFYCGKTVTEGVVDHFVAWARYPVDTAHNFVLADSRCNGQKSDYLAATKHLGKWAETNLASPELSARFDAAGVIHDAERSRQVAVWAYEQGEQGGSFVWVDGRQFVPLTADWRGCF